MFCSEVKKLLHYYQPVTPSASQMRDTAAVKSPKLTKILYQKIYGNYTK